MTVAMPSRRLDRGPWLDRLRSSSLPFGTRGVLAILATYMDPDGGGAFPSLDTLAEACGLSRRHVTNHLRPALDAGWLQRTSSRGPGASTRYFAAAPIASAAAESGQPASRSLQPSPGTRLPESGQPASWSPGSPLPTTTPSTTPTTTTTVAREPVQPPLVAALTGGGGGDEHSTTTTTTAPPAAADAPPGADPAAVDLVLARLPDALRARTPRHRVEQATAIAVRVAAGWPAADVVEHVRAALRPGPVMHPAKLLELLLPDPADRPPSLDRTARRRDHAAALERAAALGHRPCSTCGRPDDLDGADRCDRCALGLAPAAATSAPTTTARTA